ncbi:unnamed protein product [Aureobasidium uvarum]|uniref:Lytic polysaccharide monooxygenase n=1 Tax=Aureobasidium uvarum TaxID=2773716 RepID=A0A9N8PWB9_9PEZI|nr:unnamed protein product [Aureobasidium uvarum]
MYTSTVLLGSVLALIAKSNAHVVMNTPTPYGFSTLQTSPLNGQGYNFPCQSGSRANAFDATGVSNPMKVGEDNDLKFTGSAVHGGGSCQLSVTYEYPPPADKSKWKVIHSYIGSCPVHAEGNIAEVGKDVDGRPTGAQCTGDNQSECLKDFKFQIPEGMKNGNATLAWTWFNKIGNREMYMNCAPISITGGSDDDTFFNSLPELYVANIPNECKFKDQSLVVGFPEPGKFVTYGEAATPGDFGCPTSADPAPGSGSNSTQSYTSAAPYAASVPATAPTSYAAASSPYAPVPSLATSVSVAPVVPMASGTGYAAPVNSTSGACSGGKVSCPSPGALVCIDENTFGICDIDYCAVPRPVSLGTSCSNNVVSKRDVVRRRSSRIHRHIPNHIHHKHSF